MSKNITDIDKNLLQQTALPEGTVLHNVLSEPFDLYGLYRPRETGLFHRASEAAQNDGGLLEGARRLMRHTAGGRVRFKTDSRNISVYVKLPSRTKFSHMTYAGISGFDMYVCARGADRHVKTFLPPSDQTVTEYISVHTFESACLREITLHFPLYNEVSELYIGLDGGAELQKGRPYRHKKPVLVYGSSVTHGCSASRPGMCHTNILSRWLDCDTVNFGFSGSDKGEAALAEYIAKLPMSVFVHSYGPNAPSLEHYEQTYYPFYRIIRDRNPDLPIIMKANTTAVTGKEPLREEKLTRRREIVMSAYLRGRREGDQNLWYVDGFSARGFEGEEATVDGGHPTDIGFYNMASAVCPVLRMILDRKGK